MCGIAPMATAGFAQAVVIVPIHPSLEQSRSTALDRPDRSPGRCDPLSSSSVTTTAQSDP
jgi:hypothetical protein